MSTKLEVIKEILRLLSSGAGVRNYGPNSVKATVQDLEGYTVTHLETKLQELRAEAARMETPEVQRVNQGRIQDREAFLLEQTWSSIFSTVLPGTKQIAVDTQANRNIISGWVDEVRDEKLSPEWFANVIAENPKLIAQITTQSADVLDPKKRKEAEYITTLRDRDVFNETARKLELYGITEANWGLVHSTLGPDLNEFRIQQAVRSGTVRLSPPTPAEIQEWRQSKLEERQNFLTHADHAELKRVAKQETEQRRVDAQREHVQQQIQVREQLDAQQGYPALPDTNAAGVKLDATFLKNLDGPTLKNFMRKYGAANVTARINGVR